jgi:pimeloyl-ACP methyl ester carboxylesterase
MLATIPAPVGLLARFLFGRFRTTELQALFDRALSQVSASTLAERLRAVMSVDVSAELERVSVPVLYLKAASDQLVPASAAAYIRTLKPEAREVEIEGSHFLLQVSPKKAALAVRSFVAAVSLHRGPAPLVE